MSARLRLIALALLWAGFAVAAAAQPALSRFTFATLPQARAVLGARDDYVLAMGALERSAKTRSAQAVDEDRYIRFMEGTALEWDEGQRRLLAPVLQGLERFVAPMKDRLPARIQLIQSSDALMDGLPHTRGAAIILPRNVLGWPPEDLVYILGHEMFHVLSRADAGTRDKLYAAIGFRPCARVEIPPRVAALRITNPDAPVSRHTIAVRYLGKPVEALPLIRLGSLEIDPREGFARHLEVAWLLVERDGGACRARAGGAEEMGVAPRRLEGLFEQIGRNTEYLFHPEEILADNFAMMFLIDQGVPRQPPSPELLERVRRILFK